MEEGHSRTNGWDFTLFFRFIWEISDWISSVCFIVFVEDISNDKYTPIMGTGKTPALTILYILLFALKTIFLLISWFRLIRDATYILLKARVIRLWFIFIPLTICACTMSSPIALQNPWLSLIIIIHIASIMKQCFHLTSFPFNVAFQYVLSLMFGVCFTLLFIVSFNERNKHNVFDTSNDINAFRDYAQIVVFFISTLFLSFIAIKPISILWEGKYPKFVMPVYRDYYNSEDGGWRNDEYSQYEQNEQTAISNMRNQILSVPQPTHDDYDDTIGHSPVHGGYNHNHNASQGNHSKNMDANANNPLSHSLINMISDDILLPTKEPTVTEKCFYWTLSIVFVFCILIPTLMMMIDEEFSFIKHFYSKFDSMDEWDEYMTDRRYQYGLFIVDFLLVIPSIVLCIHLFLLSVLRLFGVVHCCCFDTSALFWCLFSQKYFDMIAVHRGIDHEQQKEQFYSSLFSFKKRRGKSSDDSIIADGIDEEMTSTKPKAPPPNIHLIASLGGGSMDSTYHSFRDNDSSLDNKAEMQQIKYETKKQKQKPIESKTKKQINNKNKMEKKNEADSLKNVYIDSYNYQSMDYLMKKDDDMSIDKSVTDHASIW